MNVTSLPLNPAVPGMSDAAVWALSAGACILWLLSFVWAWRTQKVYAVVLVLATFYCLTSEYLAIQLGKYEYARFPLTLTLPSVALLETFFKFLNDHGFVKVLYECRKIPIAIPLEVALIEATLLLTIIRITNLLLPSLPTVSWSLGAVWLWIAVWIGRPALTGLVAVNLDAVLDPVVSGTKLCGDPLPAPGLALWTWHTTTAFPGIWFGVPLPNYTAWFAGMFAFAAAIRICRHCRQVGPTRTKQAMFNLKALGWGLLFLIPGEFVLKLSLDSLLGITYFQTHWGLSLVAWQVLAITGVLLAGLAIAYPLFRHFKTDSKFEWPIAGPHVFVFIYCLAGLILAEIYLSRPWLPTVWIVVTLVGLTFVAAPYCKRPIEVVSRRLDRGRRLPNA